MEGVGPLWAGEEMLRWILCTIYLMVCAAQDIRRRKIGIRLSAMAGAAALLLDGAAFVSRGTEALTYTGGLLPGALLLVLALVSEGAAGTGDGICFLVLGALLGTWMTWIVLMCALVLASVCGAVLMFLRKAGRKTHMPFLAFTAAAWAGILAARLSGIEW